MHTLSHLYGKFRNYIADNQSDQGRMVLLIAGPPVEVGVTMYVLSISSVSEVLMVQFAFSNSYRTHNDSRPFISLLYLLYLLINPFPPPPITTSTPSCVYRRACTPHPSAPPRFFSSVTEFSRSPSVDRSIDRSDRARTRNPPRGTKSTCRARRSSHYAACSLDCLSRAILSNPRA